MRVSIDSISLKNPSGFLVIDGVNGSGKSSLQEHILKFLEERGIKSIKTREPGGTPLGLKIRSIFFEGATDKLSPWAEAFLFCADRTEHVSKLIRPNLEKGIKVISDRYYYSTVAFQGYGRGLELETIWGMNRIAIQGLLPDLVILLDLDPAEGLKRGKKRDQQISDKARDTFEKEELAFHTRLRNGFLDLAEKVAEPVVVIDAARSQEAIFAEVDVLLEKWLNSF